MPKTPKRMTAKQAVAYLKTLPLTSALWWFIENVGPDDPARTDVFFYLRERVRTEK